MMWGKLIISGNNTQLFSVNVIIYCTSKAESQADSEYSKAIFVEFHISAGGNTMDLRYTHSLSELLAIRYCYLRILQGCWLSDWCLYCVYGPTLLWGLPSSRAALLFQKATWLPGRPLLLPGATDDSNITSVEVPGFPLSLHCCTNGNYSDSSISKCFGGLQSKYELSHLGRDVV